MSSADIAQPMPRPHLRWQAFAIHLGLSLLLLAGLWGVLAWLWFPGFLFTTDGGDRILRLVAAVHLALGPPLTLAVASPTKSARSLWRDLAVIGLLQLSVFAGGSWLAWNSRPYAVFLVDGTLFSQPRSAFDDEPAALRKIREMALASPAWIEINLPADLDERGRYIDEAMRRKSSVVFDPRLYTPFSYGAASVQRAAQRNVEKNLSDKARTILKESGIDSAAMANGKWLIFPLRSRYGHYVLVMNPGNGKIERTLIEDNLVQEQQ